MFSINGDILTEFNYSYFILPGPDGFNARFYQKNWSVVGKDVTAAIKSFSVSGCICQGIGTPLP